MANMKLKFEDFEAEKLSTNQQKMVRGGDGEEAPTPPIVVDPGKDGRGGLS
ncbi:rSAM-modified peptide [Flavobacterium sp. LC2016-12]|uniref:rSAM-modified peptide n=1 Tax=Flavobacterium sp. LC2016-12 TaxID=2783794 RepID=UPI00188A511A|nr:rSAM-modified peptide [Flavobacterium sp. LC2016-12]MBF4464567.1 rSAM-modified peptide [Flavobacterium sp. LC2016-12]